MSSNNKDIRDRIAQNDVTMARSYLEVDFMEWLSEEEIPFGYEPFIIPSIAGPGREEWDSVVEAIRAVGNDEYAKYDEVTKDTLLSDTRPVELLSMWNDIYDKHRLQEEQITVEVKRSLANYSKKMILPDFAIYEDFDMDSSLDNFDWSSWDYIIEVSGLWGVGLPGESTESDWWDWYRVSAVAFKELAYKLLGIWDSVYWVVPFEPHIPGVTDGIPKPIREDEHYVVANITRSDLGLDGLADVIGITTENLDAKLSPSIVPAKYERPSRGIDNTMTKVEYEYDGVNMKAINANEKAVAVSDSMVMYHGDMGEVYVGERGVFVRESQWRRFNMIMLREYVLDALSTLSEDGIVEGLKEVGG